MISAEMVAEMVLVSVELMSGCRAGILWGVHFAGDYTADLS